MHWYFYQDRSFSDAAFSILLWSHIRTLVVCIHALLLSVFILYYFPSYQYHIFSSDHNVWELCCLSCMGSEVLTALTMKIVTFLDVMLFKLTARYQCQWGTYCLCLYSWLQCGDIYVTQCDRLKCYLARPTCPFPDSFPLLDN